MSTVPSIVIDGIDYVPVSSAPQQGDLSIVILQRGRVIVGRLTLDGDPIITCPTTDETTTA